MTTGPELAVTIDDVIAAADRFAGGVPNTPFLHSQTLSQIAGAEVWLKFENLQFTASFKERGSLNRLLLLPEEDRSRGVIAASAGNHAQGVAYHAERLGIPAVIVMPRLTPSVKVERTRAFGAEIVLDGDGFDESAIVADRLAAERGLTLVHPYNDPAVMAGQGTIALEMLADKPDLDAMIISVGGGGLISGMAVAARSVRPDIELVGVQSERYPGMVNALAGEETPAGRGTIAEGIAVIRPGSLTIPVVRELVDDVVTVTEGELEAAILMLLEIEKTVVEGAGAAGMAALMADRERFAGRSVGIVLCGGNIDPTSLSGIIRRGLVRSGRLARLRVELPDDPGSLARLTSILAEAGANIEQINHQRAFSHVPLRETEVDIEVQTRGWSHVDEIVAALTDTGYEVFRT